MSGGNNGQRKKKPFLFFSSLFLGLSMRDATQVDEPNCKNQDKSGQVNVSFGIEKARSWGSPASIDCLWSVDTEMELGWGELTRWEDSSLRRRRTFCLSWDEDRLERGSLAWCVASCPVNDTRPFERDGYARATACRRERKQRNCRYIDLNVGIKCSILWWLFYMNCLERNILRCRRCQRESA